MKKQAQPGGLRRLIGGYLMQAIQKMLKALWTVEATICVLAFTGTALALMADVLAREFFGNGIK